MRDSWMKGPGVDWMLTLFAQADGVREEWPLPKREAQDAEGIAWDSIGGGGIDNHQYGIYMPIPDGLKVDTGILIMVAKALEWAQANLHGGDGQPEFFRNDSGLICVVLKIDVGQERPGRFAIVKGSPPWQWMAGP